jgi:putative signal transducing protein
VAPLRLLITAGDDFEASVLRARLRSEGIDATLAGSLGGLYGPRGPMARVDVYVAEECLDDARLVLLADEIDAPDLVATRRAPEWSWGWRLAALVALTGVVLGALAGVLLEITS